MGHAQDPSHPTGIRVTGESGKAATRPRERKSNAALELRLMGYGWDDIATIVGYPTPRDALVAFENAMERQFKDDPTSTAKMRDLAGRRLERLLRAAWGKANDPDHPEQMSAIERCRGILNDHARLFGLHAPTEMVVHSPTQAEIHSFVAKVVNAANAELEEDDIFDASIVEDDEPKQIGA
jgi:hypothetical protein